LEEPRSILVVNPFVNQKHNPVTNLEEVWYEIRFPHDFVKYLNRKWILSSPLPSHKRKLGTKTNNIQNIGAHEKWRVNPPNNTPFSSVF